MQFVSEFQDEYEVLIARGMSVSLEPTVRLKMMVGHEGGSLSMAILRRLLSPESKRHTKVAVVEGDVRRPAGVPGRGATSAAAVDSEGSFEGMVAKHGRRISSGLGERFAEAKPRGLVVGRNRTRRRSAGLRRKARRRASRRLPTIRSSSSGRKD